MKTTRIGAKDEPAGIDEQELFDALKDNLSPQAIAAMATYLMAGKTANREVSREITWFTNRLVGDILGGPEALDRLVKEAGL